MDFRWVVAITLWTVFSGPVFAPPQAVLRPTSSKVTAAASDAAALVQHRTVVQRR
jgi:hypothetical protein